MGTLLGMGTINISFPYVRGDFAMNCTNFEGTLNITSGQFRIVAATDLSKATVKLGSGVYAVHTKSQSGTETQLTTKMGSLSSTAGDAQLSTGTWNVGYLGKNDTYAGTFTGNLNKYGDGTLALTGKSIGALAIYAGAVQANNTSDPITSALTTVRSGGTLSGNGKVGNVSVLRNGTIAPGKLSTVVATLTVNGSLNVASGGIISLKARRTATRTTCDALKVSETTTLNSPQITINLLGSNLLEAGDELEIFTGDGNITLNGTVTLQPERPADGLRWDTSALATEGVLRVIADPDAIEGTQKSNWEHRIYDLSGRKLNDMRSKGIYIIDGQKELKRSER